MTKNGGSIGAPSLTHTHIWLQPRSGFATSSHVCCGTEIGAFLGQKADYTVPSLAQVPADASRLGKIGLMFYASGAQRSQRLPEVIYLDSAHEEGEVLP